MEADLLTRLDDIETAPQHVLVVDDDPFFRESLQQNLIDAGYEALAFDGGAAVLSFLEDAAPVDLILLDWRMPGMTGIEVLRQLREGGVETPVIFLTALSDQMYEEAALIGGAVDFIEKSQLYDPQTAHGPDHERPEGGARSGGGKALRGDCDTGIAGSAAGLRPGVVEGQ